MKRPARVLVHWQPEKMAHLSTSNKYITVARFLEYDVDWPEQAWSIAIEFPDPEAARSPSCEATASFLVASAPWNRLAAGHIFDLYEGRKKTATVEVL